MISKKNPSNDNMYIRLISSWSFFSTTNVMKSVTMANTNGKAALITGSRLAPTIMPQRLIPLTPGLRNMVTCGAPWHKNK